MSSMSITKAQERIESLQSRLRGMRGRTDAVAQSFQRKAVMAATGFAVGRVQRDAQARGQVEAFSIAGLPTDLTVAGAAFLTEQVAGGRIGELAGAVADAALVIAAHRMGREGTAGR